MLFRTDDIHSPGGNMKKRIGVLTENKLLYDKIRLLLRERADVELITDGNTQFDITLEDIDTSSIHVAGSITMSSISECDISLPFRHEDMLSIIDRIGTDDKEYISMSGDGRNVYLGSEKIRLTDVEYRLLDVLMSADGDYVSRATLLASIWGEGFDAGVVNVYVHYLRHKLEKSGRKIILSSRNAGYGIDKKYRRDR